MVFAPNTQIADTTTLVALPDAGALGVVAEGLLGLYGGTAALTEAICKGDIKNCKIPKWM